MRKKLFYVLIGIFIIQLLIPAYMIGYSLSIENNIEKNGGVYYIEIDPHTVGKDNKVYFNVYEEASLRRNAENNQIGEDVSMYVQIDTNSEGLAYLHDVSYNPPKSSNYIKNKEEAFNFFPINYYSLDDDTAQAMAQYIEENRFRKSFFDYDNPDDMRRRYSDIITARITVYKGKVIIKGIMINGTPIEEYFKNS